MTKAFEFTFEAAAGIVVFETKGGVESHGVASFLNDTAGLTKCKNNEAGELKFEAVAAGKF